MLVLTKIDRFRNVVIDQNRSKWTQVSKKTLPNPKE
jgi:hypothetical protein